MPAPLHCRAGSGTAASATPAQGHLQMFSVQEGEVFRDPWEQSPSSLVQASQSWDEQKPSTFLSCESPVSLCTVLPIRTAILSASQPSWAPRFHASANSFHLSSAPPHPCPPAVCTCDLFPVRPPSPACCHSELKFKACSRPWTGQWFSVPVEQETTWQGYQNPAVLG